MVQRVYKHLTARDRHMIFVLRKQRSSLSDIARRIGKNKSTVSRELRRNATRITAQDRLFYFRVDNCWNEEQRDRDLDAHPEEDRRVRMVWRRHQAQLCAEWRARRARVKRRRKTAQTRKWVIEKLRAIWSPQQIAGRSHIDGP